MKDAEIERSLREHPPEIGKLSKLRQAAIPQWEGGLEYVQARMFMAAIPQWGEGPSIALGVYDTGNINKWHKWTCFDWHLGRFIADGRTRAQAIHRACVLLAKHTRAEYQKIHDEIIEKNGGKNMN